MPQLRFLLRDVALRLLVWAPLSKRAWGSSPHRRARVVPVLKPHPRTGATLHMNDNLGEPLLLYPKWALICIGVGVALIVDAIVAGIAVLIIGVTP